MLLRALLLLTLSPLALACKSAAPVAAATPEPAQPAIAAVPQPAPQVNYPQLPPPPHIDGKAAFALTKELLAVAPKRFNGSPGHLAAENFIKAHFAPEAADHRLDIDTFSASTPAGQQTMDNIIVRYPGKKDGIIVLATHYETNYPLKDIAFYGANDGACTTALLIEIGEYLRTHPPDGYSVYLLFDDGEEAVKDWSANNGTDNTYGTRHIAARWSQDDTLGKIKAFLLTDMIGDKDLNINPDSSSDPKLVALLRVAAKDTNHVDKVLQHDMIDEEDDDQPFYKRGVPTLDLMDVDYGPHNNATPDGYHHTAQDTIDKLSPQSLQVSADIVMQMMALVNQRM